jgi:hypothetical protein
MEHLTKTAVCKRYGIPTYETHAHYDNAIKALLIYYHDTAIATIFDDGRLKIDNGGWWSKTTKNRINAILSALGLPFFIRQVQWEWYLEDDSGITYPLKNETNYNGYHFTAYFDTNTKVLLPQGD